MSRGSAITISLWFEAGDKRRGNNSQGIARKRTIVERKKTHKWGKIENKAQAD